MARPLRLLGRCAAALVLLGSSFGGTVHAESYGPPPHLCTHGSPLCTDVAESLNVFHSYVGHDEPSLVFYSNQSGSGNSTLYQLRLPQDPPVQPTNDGTGGTFNFQNHPAFWVGMALCDNQSAPLPSSKRCRPDSDTNIFDSADPSNPKYIGNHPGTAFVEMQLYPPGWVPWPASQFINGGSSCDATRWCAALAIFSLQLNMNVDGPSAFNNVDCQNRTGVESFNFAFVTKNGVPTGPPDPFSQTTAGTFTPNANRDLFMSSGDLLTIDMHDTENGLQVRINDQSSGQHGSMTASPQNGFAQVVFDPTATTCTEKPYAFHPMYSTASEHTRVAWAAHTYNVAFSDELGHFEYCPQVSGDIPNATCTATTTASDPGGTDADDQSTNCAPANESTHVLISGCTGSDFDFDGVPYQARSWPGTGTSRKLVSTPIVFSSPLFNGRLNYDRVAFEADMPAIQPNPPCALDGTGCTNPPPGANFYPIYTTGRDVANNGPQGDQQGNDGRIEGCVWQFGGPAISGTTNNFGGNSVTEYGATFEQVIPIPGGPLPVAENNRRILSSNPCPTEASQG
jgi:hypothetical protein